MDGSDGPSSQSAKDLAKNLSKDITENITLWDERLSSQGAFNLSNELAINSSKEDREIGSEFSSIYPSRRFRFLS